MCEDDNSLRFSPFLVYHRSTPAAKVSARTYTQKERKVGGRQVPGMNLCFIPATKCSSCRSKQLAFHRFLRISLFSFRFFLLFTYTPSPPPPHTTTTTTPNICQASPAVGEAVINGFVPSPRPPCQEMV